MRSSNSLVKQINSHVKILIVFVALVATVFTLTLGVDNKSNVKAAGTYTVCPLGCDFVTLGDAILSPLTNNGVIQLVAAYVFDPILEPLVMFTADDTVIECFAGSDTFGDAAEASRMIWQGSLNTIQDCNFENVNFDASGKNDVQFLRNTFSPLAASQLTFTGSTDFVVSDNIGIQKVQIQNADDGLISGNTFECRFGNNCLTLSTAGGGPFDFFDPADVPTNIDILNNVISNYNITTGGDFIQFYAGLDIDFIGNTVNSGVVIDDNYLTMMTLEQGEFYLSSNYIVAPDRAPPATNSTWAINLRFNDEDLYAEIENNTLVLNNGSSTCVGLFEGGATVLANLFLDLNYNLCSNSGSPGATGLTLQYSPAFTNIVFTDSYNGLSNIDNVVQDPNTLITGLDSTTTFDNVVYRTENVSTTDDYHPAPMSRYLDVNGILDIGAYSDVRTSSYTIDDNCVVDYVSCHSQFSTTLEDVLSSNDDVTIRNGTYSPIIIDRVLTNVQITGEGASTIFPSSGGEHAISFEDVSDSTISNLSVHDSEVTILYTFETTKPIFEYSSNIYDDSLDVGLPALSALLILDSTCNVAPIDMDGIDITGLPGVGLNNINLGLVDLFGFKLTILAPNNFVTDGVQLADYLLNQCGVPATVDYFLPDLFTVSSNIYTYNTADVASAGITVAPGITDPPQIDTTSTQFGFSGIALINSSNNTLEDITFTNNDVGVNIDPTSTGNNFITSNLTSNVNAVYSTSTGTNSLTDSTFGVSTLRQIGAGTIEIYYSFDESILRSSDSQPIVGATVEVRNALNAVVCSATSGVGGLTAICGPILTAIIPNGGPYAHTTGGLNPFTFSVSATGYDTLTQQGTIQTPFNTFVLSLAQTPVVVPTVPTPTPAATPTSFPVSGPVQTTTTPRPTTTNVGNDNEENIADSEIPNPTFGRTDNNWLILVVCITLPLIGLFILYRRREHDEKEQRF